MQHVQAHAHRDYYDDGNILSSIKKNAGRRRGDLQLMNQGICIDVYLHRLTQLDHVCLPGCNCTTSNNKIKLKSQD